MFALTAIKSGTLSDRASAMAVLIQENPLANLRFVEALLTMAKKKGRREAEIATSTLKDVFFACLLPDRNLRYFHTHTCTFHTALPC
jgi:ribosome biogenesis protein MAK21